MDSLSLRTKTNNKDMANFNSLAMSKHFVDDSRIHIKKSFFGLCKKYYYAPTDSLITACRKEYTPSDGYKIEQAMNSESSVRVKQMAALGKKPVTTLGNYMLEMYQSADCQFAAVQLYQFKQLSYEPVTPVYTFEGEDARTIVNTF